MSTRAIIACLLWFTEHLVRAGSGFASWFGSVVAVHLFLGVTAIPLSWTLVMWLMGLSVVLACFSMFLVRVLISEE